MVLPALPILVVAVCGLDVVSFGTETAVAIRLAVVGVSGCVAVWSVAISVYGIIVGVGVFGAAATRP